MKVGNRHYKTVWFERGETCLIDQNALPFKFRIVRCRTFRATAAAIKDMTVRGAGAIGVAAGFAMAQAALAGSELASARRLIESTRPTAENLFYAVRRVCEAARHSESSALEAASAIAAEDESAARNIGEYGEALVPSKGNVLTHCNAGWLAFSDWGTALAPLYAAKRKGKKIFVYVDETRPRSQGARLTAWELANEGVPHAVIADSAAGSLMRQGKIDLVIVGADRIAANGDTANKIGTYSLAVLAREHRVPFYVAAPRATFDLDTPDGDHIPIEERSPKEFFEPRWFKAMKKSKVFNPAFDVTPARLITGIITETGLIKAEPNAIRRLFHPLSIHHSLITIHRV